MKAANDIMSSELIHPGEMIRDELEARGLTEKELADKMGVSCSAFSEMLDGKKPVTTEYALMLEALLGVKASIWLGLQADYDMQKAREDKKFMRRLDSLRRYAAVM